MAVEPVATIAELVELGYSNQMATALEGRELRMSYVKELTAEEAFNEFLMYHGIMGYTTAILNALDNCRNVEAL